MRNTLIVANQTLGGEALTAAINDRLGTGDCTFHLLVPVSDPVPTMIASGSAAAETMPIAEMPDERLAAERRLEIGLEWLTEIGAVATGEVVTDTDTAAAVCRVVTAKRFDEVIVSTLPTTVSRWLRQDLPRKIERKVSVPLTVVTSKT